MTRKSALVLALGAVALLVAETAFAGAMIKEHECVGRDTVLSLQREDAACTPPGSEIAPPGGPGNVYGAEDVDNMGPESFRPSGALEIRTQAFPNGTNRWQTVPTIKEPGFLQVGFDATFQYEMMIKSSSILSDIEVVCSVCAERPQGLGPGQTFVPDPLWFDDDGVDGGGAFIRRLNLQQQPWEMSVQHRCSSANPACLGVRDVNAITIPGLEMEPPIGEGRWVEFLGCKPKRLLVENDGTFFRGDQLLVRVDVPSSARVHATMDVTSCEASYIRGCLPGEGSFKDICVGEP